MASQSTQEDTKLDTNAFYRRTLHVLNDAHIPFLVGGSHAYLHYTGIARDTKDLDVFVRRQDCPRALEALREAGYRTELTFPHWLGKAFYGDNTVDLVFNSGNGVAVVDDECFGNAVEAQVLGLPVELIPAEDFIWQKCFIAERERFDGADVMHLLHQRGNRLNWPRLLRRFGPHWQLLLTYLVLFRFVYPSARDSVPQEVFRDLMLRFQQSLDEEPNGEPVCQGTLLSRQQFLVDIGLWGYKDARLVNGGMSSEDIVYWTWAIDHQK